MDSPLPFRRDDTIVRKGPLINSDNLIDYAPVYEFMDSLTGTRSRSKFGTPDASEYEIADIVNIESFITPYLLNDDAEGIEEFIRTYIASDHLTPQFQLIIPEITMHIWEMAILNDAWNVVMTLMELSGIILPMIDENTFTDLETIYRYFWTAPDTDIIDDAIVVMIKYSDIEMLLRNSLYYLSAYHENYNLASMNDDQIDMTFRGVFDTNSDIATIESDIATGEIHGDVGNLDLYDSNQMPGDTFMTFNSQRLIDYLDEFIKVIDLMYGSPYRSIFDVAAVLVDMEMDDGTIFELLRDEGVEFDPAESQNLLSPEQYRFIEEIGEVYGFDSSKVEEGGIFGTLTSYPTV